MHVGLGLELTSLTFIGILVIGSLITYGFKLDTSQFTAKGATTSNIVLGAVLAVGAFAGFESAASLGLETRNAHRTIARILIRVVCGLAVLYLFASYTEILGFAKLTGSSAPLHVVADYAGLHWVGYVVDVGISVSMVAFAAAVINAAARSLYTLGREGALPSALASVHSRFGSPHVGIVFLGATASAITLVFMFTGRRAQRRCQPRPRRGHSARRTTSRKLGEETTGAAVDLERQIRPKTQLYSVLNMTRRNGVGCNSNVMAVGAERPRRRPTRAAGRPSVLRARSDDAAIGASRLRFRDGAC